MSYGKTLIELGAGLAAVRGYHRLTQVGTLNGLAEVMTALGMKPTPPIQAMDVFPGFLAAMGGTAGTMADMFARMTEGTVMGDMAEDNARLMIRTLIQATKAQGAIDTEEQAAILGHITGTDPEELAFLREAFAEPVDPQALARDASTLSKAQVYGLSLMAITFDDTAHVSYLDTLATALGLDDAARGAIHTRLGIRPA